AHRMARRQAQGSQSQFTNLQIYTLIQNLENASATSAVLLGSSFLESSPAWCKEILSRASSQPLSQALSTNNFQEVATSRLQASTIAIRNMARAQQPDE